MHTQYVGILVNQSVYRGIPTGGTGHEQLSLYEEAGKSFGLTPCYFRLRDVDLAKGCVSAYVRGLRGYRRIELPLPRVIHNRAILRHTKSKRKLQRLSERGIAVFNACTRYGKLAVHTILMDNPKLRPHLPGTALADPDSIRRFMQSYDYLIIKPDNSSIGRGVMVLRRNEAGWRLMMAGSGGPVAVPLKDESRLPDALLAKIRAKRHIVQQRLPLATYMGRPFDLRVSVQKNREGRWQVTGIVGKYAAKNKWVTNVAQGGSVITLKQLMREYPQLSYRDVTGGIEQFSLDVANTLDKQLDGLADIGLDVGITEFGYPVFIECNCRDLRYSFKSGGMLPEWKATYANPIGYADYLMNRER